MINKNRFVVVVDATTTLLTAAFTSASAAMNYVGLMAERTPPGLRAFLVIGSEFDLVRLDAAGKTSETDSDKLFGWLDAERTA